MTDTVQFDNPNDIDNIDTLKIQPVSGNLSPKIYANGKNQLPIEVTAKAVDKDNKVLNFSKETWIHILNLCFAESNDKLSWKYRSGWCFTDEENDYSKEIEVASAPNTLFSVRDDGTVIIIMYVYTDEIEKRRIAVRVDTDSKHFTTADNSSGVEKMSISVTAIQEIDYSNKVNLDIQSKSFTTISSNLLWTSRLNVLDIFKTHKNGTCQQRIVKIYPVKNFTGQEKFKKHEIIYDEISNSDVNLGTIEWSRDTGNGWENYAEDCFSLINNFSGRPCAVIGSGEGRNDYQINFWFSINNAISLSGQVYLKSTSYYYRFIPYLDAHHENDNNEGIPKLVLYKFTMPDNADHKYNWRNVIRTVTVKVTDFYGNEGAFKLLFNDTDSFDCPSIQ